MLDLLHTDTCWDPGARNTKIRHEDAETEILVYSPYRQLENISNHHIYVMGRHIAKRARVICLGTESLRPDSPRVVETLTSRRPLSAVDSE